MSRAGKTSLVVMAYSVVAGALGVCQEARPPGRHKVLVLILDQPIRPFARELLEGIQESTRDSIGVSLFIEFIGPTALESETVAAQRRQLLAVRYVGQPIELIVAIGDRTVKEAEQLRKDLFPGAKLLFLVVSPEAVREGVHQGDGLYIDSSPWPSVELALSLMPKKSRLIVISGTTALDQMLRKAVSDGLQKFPRKIEATYLNGLPLPELRAQAPQFPDDAILVITSNMADRSGRATTNIDLAYELSRAGKIPVIEGTDLSIGYGSLGGDLAAYRRTGGEIGRRIQHTLETGQAPAAIRLEAAPRRYLFDWRQLKRFGISENQLPPGSEVLYRQATLWEQHRTLILLVIVGVILQGLLIAFLLAERRRRADAQAKMHRQLKLEAAVSKASADLSAATEEDLPARLNELSAGLSESIEIERTILWVLDREHGETGISQSWSDSTVVGGFVSKRFPYLYGELLAGRTAVIEDIDGIGSMPTPEMLELRRLGVCSLIMIPLVIGGAPLAALLVGTARRGTKWAPEAISTLRVLANVLAQAISRSRSEQRVLRSEEQNRAMLASLPGFVLMIDGSGGIVRQNNRLELNPSELPDPLFRAHPGENFLDLWRSDGDSGRHIATALEDIIQGDNVSLVMEYLYEKNGESRWIEVHAERLLGEQPGAVVSHTDITERKKTEREHAQNRETVWHLTRVAAMGELTASLAHEINQPLAAILNSAEAAAVLLNKPLPNIEETLEAIRDIIDDDKRAGAVISRMRSMLKRGSNETQAVDLNATVNETLRLVVNEARLRRVALHHLAGLELPPVVADPTQLQQVILNLVTNAIEAAESIPGGCRIEIRTMQCHGNENQILEVWDNGPGIPQDRLKTVFEPFYTTKRDGLGLGLSICRSIVESFGGRITAESSPLHGTVFRLTLRAVTEVPEEAQHAMRASA